MCNSVDSVLVGGELSVVLLVRLDGVTILVMVCLCALATTMPLIDTYLPLIR